MTMQTPRCLLPLGTAILCAATFAVVRAGEEKVALDKLPKPVVEAVKKRFPKAEMLSAVKETTDGKTAYEVTVKDDGRKIDVSVTAEGTITTLEKEITAKELPKAVTKALEAKYPKATYKRIEEVVKVEGGKETLEFYEVLLETADKMDVEVQIGADGKIKGGDKKKGDKDSGWTSDFSMDKADLASTGRNPYFILEPGYQLILEGGGEKHWVTVLNETKMVDGVETRVVEEYETKNGKLVERSLNYYAISKRTNSVYYFGEHVDVYKNDKIVSHPGSWLSGVKGAKFGLMMPGLPLVGAKYQQEVAPGDAMDRAQIVSVSETVKTKLGEFKNCLKIEETTPLEPDTREYKYYAPGIGLVRDGAMALVYYGKAEPKK
jgi:hypothetical protein